jgi:recombination protein RecA
MHEEGISRQGDILDLAVDVGVVDKRGSFFYYGDDLRIAQGRENAKEYLRENPEITQEIEGEIRSLVMEQSQFDIGSGDSDTTGDEEDSLE